MDYTSLALSEVGRALDETAREAGDTFGGLDAGQLNWRPDAIGWSVAQCFEHLLVANRLMLTASQHALAHPPGLWQRVPGLPGFFGRILIQSQSPQTTRKAKTSSKATPSASAIAADVIERFVAAHRERSAWIRTLDPDAAADGHGLAVGQRHHLQRARRLPADGRARSASLRAGAAGDAVGQLPSRRWMIRPGLGSTRGPIRDKRVPDADACQR